MPILSAAMDKAVSKKTWSGWKKFHREDELSRENKTEVLDYFFIIRSQKLPHLCESFLVATMQ